MRCINSKFNFRGKAINFGNGGCLSVIRWHQTISTVSSSLRCVDGVWGADRLSMWLGLGWDGAHIGLTLVNGNGSWCDSVEMARVWTPYMHWFFFKLNPQNLIILTSAFGSQKPHSFRQNNHSKESWEKAVFRIWIKYNDFATCGVWGCSFCPLTSW